MLSTVIRPAIEAVQAGTPLTEEALQKILAQFVEDHKGDPLIKDIFGENATEFGVRAKYFASNITELATQVAGDIASHRYAIDQLDAHIALKVSNADWARSTVVNRGKSGEVIDKLVAFGRHNRVGGYLLNPATVGAVWSVGTYFASSASRKTATVGSLILAPFITPVVSTMLISGTFAAMRRWREVKLDRAMHMGEMAYGASIDPSDGKVRQEMEATAYETARIQELIDGGGQDVGRSHDREGLQAMLRRARTEPTNSDLRNDLLSRAAEIRTRLDETQIDRIRFSGREVIEQERLELLKNVVEIRRALRTAGMTDAEVDTNIRNFQNVWEDHLDKNIEDQDRKFRKYQVGQAGRAFAKGAATGLLVGFASREIGDTLLHFTVDPTRPLLLDKLHELVDSDGGTRSVLTRISDFVGGTSIRPNLHDIQEMYQTGGDFQAGHYSFTVNPVTHEINIIDDSVALNPLTVSPSEIFDTLDMKLDADGHIQLLGQIKPDMKDELQDVINSLQQEGFKITAMPQVDLDTMLPPPHETLITVAGTHMDSVPGFATQIPDGTKWIQEGTTGAWKLVIEGHEDVSLVEHVQFDADGHMIPGTWIKNPEFDKDYISVSEGSIKSLTPEDAMEQW